MHVCIYMYIYVHIYRRGGSGGCADAPSGFRRARTVGLTLPGEGNSNSHGARPVHLITTMV